MSVIKNIKNSEALDVDFDAWKLMEVEDTDIIRINLHPGKILAPHTNDKPVVFYILAGSGDLSIDGEIYNLKPKDSIFIEENRMREWTVTSEVDLEILVVKYIN